MDQIKAILKSHSLSNNVINDTKEITNNDINVNRYSLNPKKFKAHTEKTQLAVEISTKLNDTKNFAAYLGVINKMGCSEIRRLYVSVLDDIKEKLKTKTPVRKPGAYFMWKLKTHRY